MKKIVALSLIGLFALSLGACDDNDSSSVIIRDAPKGELQTIFASLLDNNFSISYEDRYANNMVNGEIISRYQNTYYTPYSLESDGDLGFNGYASNGEIVFSYNIVENEIISSLPLLNSSTGHRYRNIYDYRPGMADFVYEDLPSTPNNEDGSYTYDFGENTYNDYLISEIFLRKTYNPSIKPTSVKMTVRGNTLEINAVLLTYELGEDNVVNDSVDVVVYQINSTENVLVKDYLASGGTAKKPLDNRFYDVIAPYLETNNFKTSLDATHYLNSDTMLYETFKMDQYFLNNAIVYDRLDDADVLVSGSLETNGVVASFSMEDINADKLTITNTPLNSDSEAYTYLYGEYFPYTFSSLSFANFIGYVDEENPNLYYLTDTYLQYILAYICYFDTDTTSNKISSLTLEILSPSDNSFKLSFYVIDTMTGLDKGVYQATFSMLNKVAFNAIDRYLNMGSASDQATLESVLNKFKNNNYSLDVISGSNLAKSYFTPDYYYLEAYGDPAKNIGYVKLGEEIHQFTVSYNGSTPTDIIVGETDYAASNNPMQLPGVGSSYNAANNLFYASMLSEDIYNFDNYVIDDSIGIPYFRNLTEGFAASILSYFYPNNTSALPYGAGFLVSDSDKDSYDVRATLMCTYISRDGSQMGALAFTFYDIGGTQHDFIENYFNF